MGDCHPRRRQDARQNSAEVEENTVKIYQLKMFFTVREYSSQTRRKSEQNYISF